MARLHAWRRQLGGTDTVGALFAAAAALACEELSFERGLVLSIEGTRLNAEVTDALRDDASDRLRRRVLAAPPTLRHDVYEAELIRVLKPAWPLRPAAPSMLAPELELRNFAIAPVSPEGRALALLVVDREAPAVDALDASEVRAFADVLASVLAYVVLRARLRELADDWRHLMASSQAVLREALETSVTLPTNVGTRPAFPLIDLIARGSESGLGELLSEGEIRIALLLVEGRSNREIAEELTFSPETVKAHVARILRKLGAPNRAKAVAVILGMQMKA